MRKHTAEDHYVCDECGKSYKFLAPFLHHKIVHENKFDYSCSYCNKAFRKMRDKVVHERIHSGGNYNNNSFCPRVWSIKFILTNVTPLILSVFGTSNIKHFIIFTPYSRVNKLNLVRLKSQIFGF